MEKKEKFKGWAKPTTLFAKILSIIFLIGFSLFYYGFKQNDVTIASALGIAFLTITIDVIFMSINLSMMINNIAKLKNAVLGSETIMKKINEKEDIE